MVIKKFVLMFFVCTALFCTGFLSSYAENFNEITDNAQVVYEPVSDTWFLGGITKGRISLTKHSANEIGSYSQYKDETGKLVFATSSDYEFIKNGELIFVNNSCLKYSKIVYQDGKFKEVELTDEELHNIFPNVEIVNISNFEDDKICLKKKCFKSKTVLLKNDTKRYFYRLVAPSNRMQNQNINGLIKFSHIGKYKFVHYGEQDGKLFIYVI